MRNSINPKKFGGGYFNDTKTDSLENPKVFLRKIDIKDTSNILKWRNSKSVKNNLYSQEDLTEEQHICWLNNKVFTGLCAQYIISVIDNESSQDIGTVFIKNIDHTCHKGEFGIQIGEESARGKGYGTEATLQILRIAFDELRLNRVYLTVLSNNIAAKKSYLKAGFLTEGILKEDYCRNGKFYDVELMAITKSQWIS